MSILETIFDLFFSPSEEYIDKEERNERNAFFSELSIGQVLDGEVIRVESYGALVDLRHCIKGLLHISNLSWDFVDDPTKVVSVGQTLRVVILAIDEEKKRVSLGLKQLTPSRRKEKPQEDKSLSSKRPNSNRITRSAQNTRSPIKSNETDSYESQEIDVFNSDEQDIATIVRTIREDNIELEFLRRGRINFSPSRFFHFSELKVGYIVGLDYKGDEGYNEQFEISYVLPKPNWQLLKLQSAKRDNKIITAKVLYKCEDKGYYTVNVFGTKALLYENQVANDRKLKEGEEISVLVNQIKGEYQPEYVLLSNSRATQQLDWIRQKEEITKNKKDEFDSLKIDEIVNVAIEKIEPTYVIVNFGSLNGIIHKSNLFWGNVRRIDLYLSIGTTIQAKVLSKEKENDKFLIRLNHKVCIPDIWNMIEIDEDEEIDKAVLAEVVDDGVYISIDNGLEGFLPITEMSRMEYKAFQEWAPEDGEVMVIVKKFDRNRRQLIFTRKPYYDEVWDEIDSHYQTNQVYQGTVIDLEDVCIWVLLQEDIEAQIPKNELQWDKAGGDASLYQVGQTVNILLTKIDAENRCLQASIRLLTPDPWDVAQSLIKGGEIVKVRVLNYKGQFMFVETLDNLRLQGRIRLSEFSWIHKPNDLPDNLKPEEDSVVDAKIRIWQPEKRYIELSIRQIEKDPWSDISIGVTVVGYVDKVDENGVAEVHLENGLNAISQDVGLNDQEGNSLHFRVIECNRTDRVIIVSHHRLLHDKKTDRIVRKFFNPQYISEE